MAVINGNSFTLVVDTSDSDTKMAFAHSQEASLSFSNELVEATLDTSEGWSEFISGKKTAQISFKGLQDYGTITNRYNIDDLAEYLLDSSLLYFEIGDNANNANDYGKGYISEITLEGGTDDVATYSGTLVVTEELNEARLVTDEFLQDSDGEDILDDAGDRISVRVFR